MRTASNWSGRTLVLNQVDFEKALPESGRSISRTLIHRVETKIKDTLEYAAFALHYTCGLPYVEIFPPTWQHQVRCSLTWCFLHLFSKGEAKKGRPHMELNHWAEVELGPSTSSRILDGGKQEKCITSAVPSQLQPSQSLPLARHDPRSTRYAPTSRLVWRPWWPPTLVKLWNITLML